MIDSLIQEVVAGSRSLRSALEQMAGPRPESVVQIVIAPRGWVFVGYCHKDESDLVISRAHVIRKWGTKKGLGELVSGPKQETILDSAGIVRVPLCAVIARIICEEAAWNTKI
jgi:hypothetical protein